VNVAGPLARGKSVVWTVRRWWATTLESAPWATQIKAWIWCDAEAAFGHDLRGGSADGMKTHTFTAMGCGQCTLRTDSARVALGHRVLEMLEQGYSVPFIDAIQLRNWAVRPADIWLPLAEIARGILDQEENPMRPGNG
jgi:hypothetical protein